MMYFLYMKYYKIIINYIMNENYLSCNYLQKQTYTKDEIIKTNGGILILWMRMS